MFPAHEDLLLPGRKALKLGPMYIKSEKKYTVDRGFIQKFAAKRYFNRNGIYTLWREA